MRLIALLCAALPMLAAAAEPAPAAREIPAELREAVDTAAWLGTVLFVHDSAAARATDEMVRRGLLDKDDSIRGWLTRQLEEPGFEVTWVSEEQGQLVAKYIVEVPVGNTRPRYRKLKPARPLSEAQAAQWAARELASQAVTESCAERFNPVVITLDHHGERFNLVYLLAATTRANVAVAGGHQRFEVSSDGKRIEDKRSFTKSCLEIPLPERGVALMLTHLLDPTPTEVHVFLSKIHGMPIYVATGDNTWRVDGSKISLLDKAIAIP
jgi:hypothetical protein